MYKLLYFSVFDLCFITRSLFCKMQDPTVVLKFLQVMDNTSENLGNDLMCTSSVNTTNLTRNCVNELKPPYTLKQLKDLHIFLVFFEWFQTVEYLLCFIANILTVTAVIKYENLHNKPTNILILGLACADGILGKLPYLRVLVVYVSSSSDPLLSREKTILCVGFTFLVTGRGTLLMETGFLHDFLEIYPRQAKYIIFAWNRAHKVRLKCPLENLETQKTFLGEGGIGLAQVW